MSYQTNSSWQCCLFWTSKLLLFYIKRIFCGFFCELYRFAEYAGPKEYFVDFSVNFIGLPNMQGPMWSWSYGSWIYNYLCKHYLSPLKLWVQTCSWWSVLDTTLSDKVCQWLAIGQWFTPCTPVSSTNKTDRHDIIENIVESGLKQHKPNLIIRFCLCCLRPHIKYAVYIWTTIWKSCLKPIFLSEPQLTKLFIWW